MLGGLIGSMGHSRGPFLDGHVRGDEANGADVQIHASFGVLLEDCGEDLLDPFPALGGLAFFRDDLSVRQEEPCDGLGIARIVGLGKGRGGEPDRLLVRLAGRAGHGGRVGLGGRVSRDALPRSQNNGYRQQGERHPRHGQNTSHGLQPFMFERSE